MTKEITKYIGKIRNEAKKQYAVSFAMWMLNGQIGAEPKYTLSYMGAQSVRRQLTAIMGN